MKTIKQLFTTAIILVLLLPGAGCSKFDNLFNNPNLPTPKSGNRQPVSK